MEYIGTQISIKRTEKELSIVILAFVNKLKNKILLLWLILWTVGGLIVLSQYFTIPDQNTKTAIIVWMGFWAYFEYKIFNAFLWRKSGREIIKIRDKKFFYSRLRGTGIGKIKTYETDFIKDLRVIESKENSFSENLNNSYWVIAGEKLAFDYYGNEIKFGIQLTESDAKALLKVIKNEIKR